MSLLNFSSRAEDDEMEPIPMLWANVKEVFGFLAQHPQLMGIGLILVGWFIKQTRQPSHAVRQLVPGKKMFGTYGPQDPPHYEQVIIPAMPGLDFTIWTFEFPSAGQAVEFISSLEAPIGRAVGWLLHQPVPADAPPSAAPYRITVSLGDLLILGGITGLVGPSIGSLAQLIPKP